MLSLVCVVESEQAFVDQLASSVLASPSADVELVFADDASADHTPELLEALAARDPRVRVVTLPERRGHAAARAAGVAEATGEHVWLVRSTDTVAPGAIGGLLATLADLDPDVLLVGHTVERDRRGPRPGPQEPVLRRVAERGARPLEDHPAWRARPAAPTTSSCAARSSRPPPATRTPPWSGPRCCAPAGSPPTPTSPTSATSSTRAAATPAAWPRASTPPTPRCAWTACRTRAGDWCSPPWSPTSWARRRAGVARRCGACRSSCAPTRGATRPGPPAASPACSARCSSAATCGRSRRSTAPAAAFSRPAGARPPSPAGSTGAEPRPASARRPTPTPAPPAADRPAARGLRRLLVPRLHAATRARSTRRRASSSPACAASGWSTAAPWTRCPRASSTSWPTRRSTSTCWRGRGCSSTTSTSRTTSSSGRAR